MGTRGAFWIGDPADLEDREWLGCIAWDAHPHNYEDLTQAKTAEEFRAMVEGIKAEVDHFADPKKGGWPFPWTGDVFLTDCTYAFFDGCARFCWFHERFMPLSEYMERMNSGVDEDEMEEIPDDPLHQNVPAPTKEWDRSQPDSIMLVGVRKDGRIEVHTPGQT